MQLKTIAPWRAVMPCLLLLWLVTAPVTTRGEAHADPCGDADEAKSGICGHALADIARIEAAQTNVAERAAAAAEAQEETDILHCLLDFEVFPTASPKRIDGSNTLTVRSVNDGLTQFTLDFRSNMTVSAVQVNGAPATFTRPTDQIVINLGSTFNADQTFTVKVTYTGSPSSRTDWSFSFFSTHGSGSQNRAIAASFSQPYAAHYWWPCKENWSDISDKFTLDMHVTVPDWMTVAANGLLQGTDNLTNSRKKFRWHESYPIATYLVAFGATNYTVRSYAHPHPGGSMPVDFYIYPESVSVSDPYLPTIVDALARFSAPDIYGQYPFINEKYGIMQFQWSAGMEHQTMTSQGSYTVERRNVHELAHMWWGDAITCKTWHDIWLNEGFAQFSEALYAELREGGSRTAYTNYLNQSGMRPSPSLADPMYRYDISTTAKIFENAYTYDKGSWVTHMLRFVLGDEDFFASLAAYRDAFEGGVADTQDFRAICETVSGRDLGWFFDQWVYAAGAPYYRYGWEQQEIAGQNWVRLHVEQYQKTLYGNFPSAMAMPIDIRVNTASGSQAHVVWNNATGTDSTIRQWFILPADGPVTGVQFDPETRILRGAATEIPYMPQPVKILTMSPVPGSINPGVPRIEAVRLGFSEPISYAGSHFRLAGGRSGLVTCAVTWSPGDFTITLTPPAPLGIGEWWTVTAMDGITSLATGAALDGEIAVSTDPASLPSGDGLPGGNAILQFKIAAPGDFDGNDRVDAFDFDHFAACAGGANTEITDPGCINADLDGDSDADQDDFGVLQRCFNGPAAPPPSDCVG